MLFSRDLKHRKDPWRTVDVTPGWLDCFNCQLLFEHTGDIRRRISCRRAAGNVKFGPWSTERGALVLLAYLLSPSVFARLPPVPVPPENPVTEEKRVLGKILFWDEQLSSDNTVACGTCHKPATGGGDRRSASNPGRDGTVGTDDDIMGSPGMRRLNRDGLSMNDPIYGFTPQVTDRATPSYFAAIWADALFWDGRAEPEFRDPLTGKIVIRSGGALESQSIGPILNSVEMAQEGRAWSDVTIKLQQTQPLALAVNLPPDLQQALQRKSSYPDLFEQAFGDPSITPVRIAFAIATYERTLVADQTPWDTFDAEPGGSSPVWRSGLAWFEKHNCHLCHVPPLFTNNDFKNVGIRASFHDRGRALVTDSEDDEGDMKVPSLRNAALRTSFMHTGTLRSLDDVLDLYAAPNTPPDTLPTGEPYLPRMNETARAAIKHFLETALTDPRVAAELFPFDRPRLRSERHQDDTTPPSASTRLIAERTSSGVHLEWNAASDNTAVIDYMLMRSGTLLALPTGTEYMDATAHFPWFYRYRIVARDAAGNVSTSTTALVWPSSALALLAALSVIATGLGLLWRLGQYRK